MSAEYSGIQQTYMQYLAEVADKGVEVAGKTALAQLMGLVLFGDYVSFYLAMLNETDPNSLAAVDFVKGYLARFNAGSS